VGVRLILLATVAAVLALLVAGSGVPALTRLPAPITLQGVAGVEPRMLIDEMERRWRITIPAVSEADCKGCSSSFMRGVVCAGPMRAAADFTGGGELVELRFFLGAKTDRGVGIGSTPAQLKRAYGRRLMRVPYDLYGATYGYRVVARTAPPRNAIAFELIGPDAGVNPARVIAVRFGRLANLDGRGRTWQAGGVRC
jgi:hypothetical protein